MEQAETWSNGPDHIYAPHTHPYHKTLTCLKGSIEFQIHGQGGERAVMLQVGETLEIPRDTVHSARVGPRGVTCREVHK